MVAFFFSQEARGCRVFKVGAVSVVDNGGTVVGMRCGVVFGISSVVMQCPTALMYLWGRLINCVTFLPCLELDLL